MKNKTSDLNDDVTITISKLACVILKNGYHENCNHKNYYHEIPKIYTNKFETIK